MAAYAKAKRQEVRSTLALLRYYRAFLRSDKERCRNPEDAWGGTLTKGQARSRLDFLVQTAINRKAGIPDRAGRKQAYEYEVRLRRDAQRLVDVHARIRVYQFETPELQSRFRHLLATRED